MIINLNLQRFSTEFNPREQLAIVANCIETAFRYDYESVARKIDMPGRTIFAGRGSWRTRGMLTDFLLLDEIEFQNKYFTSRPNATNIDSAFAQLNKKRGLLEDSIQLVGFERWLSEFLKIYSVNWVISRITTVMSRTRGATHENTEFNLNLSLEGVR